MGISTLIFYVPVDPILSSPFVHASVCFFDFLPCYFLFSCFLMFPMFPFFSCFFFHFSFFRHFFLFHFFMFFFFRLFFLHFSIFSICSFSFSSSWNRSAKGMGLTVSPETLVECHLWPGRPHAHHCQKRLGISPVS